MTQLTRRLQWRQAVASRAFPASQRPVKATLLSLVDLMKPTGELTAWRHEIESAIGMPPRTLNRHLARAVEDGWLVHEVQGGRNHRAVYRATIPDGSVGHSRRTEARLSRPPARQQNTASVGHPVAESIKKSANDSERVAVDDQRGRRTTPVGSGVDATDYFRKDGSNNGSGQPTPSKRLSLVTTTKGDVA